MTDLAYHYDTPPDAPSTGRYIVDIVNTDLIRARVQVVYKEGGETTLHAHHGSDEVWLVLSGRAVFYDKDRNRVEMGKNDMILIPSGCEHGILCDSDEPLELFHVIAQDPRIQKKRSDLNTTDPNGFPIARTPEFPAKAIACDFAS